MESWKFQFAATPKFQLGIHLNTKFKLDLTIQNGIITEYEVRDDAGEVVELEEKSFQTGLEHLLNTRLKYADLNSVFKEFNLLEMNNYFSLILNYFNKNIS